MGKNTKAIRAILAGVVLGALIFISNPDMLHAQIGNVEIVNNKLLKLVNLITKKHQKYRQLE